MLLLLYNNIFIQMKIIVHEFSSYIIERIIYKEKYQFSLAIFFIIILKYYNKLNIINSS